MRGPGNNAWLAATLAAATGVNGVPLLDGILNPLTDTVGAVLKGQGLVRGALGAVGGVLGHDAEYDYVVVGGGTAGNAVGYRLAEAGFDVAVVEAGLFYEVQKPVLGTTPLGDIFGIGSSPLDTNPLVDWAFVTEPQSGANDRRIHYARGKCLGGSSALNFMVYHHGSEGSYDRWAEEVGDDSYRLENFSPYFQKAVTLTPPEDDKRPDNVTSRYDPSAFKASGGGPVNVGYTRDVSTWATWLEAGLKAVGMEPTSGFSSGKLLGYHYTQTTLRASDQTRSTSTDYIYRAMKRGMKKLKVYTQTMGKKVLFDENKRATGVQVESLGIKYEIRARKEVILSAGAFQSPQLLMVSGVGPKETLQEHDIEVVADLPGTGQNMWDHIMFGPAYEAVFNTLNHLLTNPVALSAELAKYVTSQEGAFTNNNVDFVGWERLPQSYHANLSASTLDALATFPADWPHYEWIPENGLTGKFRFPVLDQPLDGRNYASILGAMVTTVSRGNVTIRGSDASLPPVINPNFLVDRADQEMAVAAYRRMRDIFQTPEVQSILVGEGDAQEVYPGLELQSDEEILEVVKDALMTVWHAACTCKMGKEGDRMAVVDARARVFGVEGLRVVDASAMPLLPPGHPQATIYALAEKIADSIIKGEE